MKKEELTPEDIQRIKRDIFQNYIGATFDVLDSEAKDGSRIGGWILSGMNPAIIFANWIDDDQSGPYYDEVSFEIDQPQLNLYSIRKITDEDKVKIAELSVRDFITGHSAGSVTTQIIDPWVFIFGPKRAISFMFNYSPEGVMITLTGTPHDGTAFTRHQYEITHALQRKHYCLNHYDLITGVSLTEADQVELGIVRIIPKP